MLSQRGTQLHKWRRSSSTSAPVHVAVVGSGPAAFYCTKELLRLSPAPLQVGIFERLATPFGLLRYGVAPDHPEVKNATADCTKVAEDSRVSWFGNVTVGSKGQLTVEQLQQYFDVVILAYGAEADRALGVPGEDLANVCSAREFVEWYNGFPGTENRSFDLGRVRNVVVIGNGNVAMDCVRILNAPPGLLEKTDITSYALAAIRTSPLRNSWVVARRSPLQAAFTIKEFRELLNLGKNSRATAEPNPWVDVVVNPENVETARHLYSTIANSRPRKRLTDLVFAAADTPARNDRRINFEFFLAPERFGGDSAGRVTEAVFRRTVVDSEGKVTPTDQLRSFPCDLVLRSIGYYSTGIDDAVPFDAKNGRVQTSSGGRVTSGSQTVPGLYATGWSQSGPTGVLASTLINAQECARAVAEDIQGNVLAAQKPGLSGVIEELRQRNVPYVDWSGWLRLAAQEQARGRGLGKIAEKIVPHSEQISASQRIFSPHLSMEAPAELVLLSNSLASVQSKVECIFQVRIVEEPSQKHADQEFSVVAIDELNPKLAALIAAGATVVATEKVDGTCTLLRAHQGTVVVWARYDRKPTKEAFQRKKRHEKEAPTVPYRYRYPEDFREPPVQWVLADDVKLDPETGGPAELTTHLVGWVPLPTEGKNAQYPWHHSAWDPASGRGLFLVPHGEKVHAEWLPLAPFEGQTVELMGPKINQRYDFSALGFPPEQHFFVRHGSLVIPPVPLTLDGIRQWLVDNNAEGVVLHVTDAGTGQRHIFKCHQHHTGLHDWGKSPGTTRLTALLVGPTASTEGA